MICDPWSTTLFELDTFFIRQQFFSLALTTLHTVPASRWTILIFPPCEITISQATMKKRKSFFAKTKWPKFSLWSADITPVTTTKLRKMYNNLWQWGVFPHYFPSRRYIYVSEEGECADALAASDNEGSRGENVFLSMRERTKPSQRGKLRGT